MQNVLIPQTDDIIHSFQQVGDIAADDPVDHLPEASQIAGFPLPEFPETPLE